MKNNSLKLLNLLNCLKFREIVESLSNREDTMKNNQNQKMSLLAYYKQYYGKTNKMKKMPFVK